MTKEDITYYIEKDMEEGFYGADCDLREMAHIEVLELLKELKAHRNNLTNQSLSDALVHSENENERLHDRVNELSKELKAHREAWEKCIKEIKEWYWNADKQAIAKDSCVVDAMVDLFIRIIKECRPKEGVMQNDGND